MKTRRTLVVPRVGATSAIILVLGAAVAEPRAQRVDPGEVAFVKTAIPPDNFDIHGICPDGSMVRRITDDPAPDFRPIWSPNGREILFTSLRSGDPDLWRMNADGGELENLTADPLAVDFRGAWFPNGQRIVFASGLPADLIFDSQGRPIAGDLEIFVMNEDGTDLRNVSNNPAFDARPLPSPDGKRIAFDSDRDGDREVYVMNADGSGVRQLTSNAGIADDHPVWSPNGRQMLFTSDRDGNLEVYVMNADGTNPRNLTNNASRDTHAEWSPDGHRIVFETDRDGNLEIYIMDSDGTSPRDVTNAPLEDDTEPHWGRHACGGR